ncbi:MAG: hypothetical protein HYS37_03610 [Candidatus Rokubacteria bacterium]|nr:hypothetical protein [Candidatus Rokubacteria bacterium]
MNDDGRPEVTLHTLHQDLGEVKGEVREVKVLVATGLRAFRPDWPAEMLRVLRENNRLGEERFARLDTTLREQAIETHTALRAVAEGQRRASADLRALIARIDALIRWRGDGSGSA